MPLPKKFLHHHIGGLNINRSQFIIGLILGLLYAITFYCLLYLMRESFRVLSLISNYDIIIFSPEETNFYNLFFGFLSAIMGQSILFQFVFGKPNKLWARKKRYRLTILHDQRFFIWFFLSWFSRCAFVFGCISFLTFDGGSFAFSLYPQYNFLFILIIIVLFYQSWNGIKKIYKKSSYKWILLSMVSICALAIGLSQIKLVDENKINEIGLKDNVYHHFNLQLPESEYYESFFRSNHDLEIFLVQDQKEGRSKIIFRNKEFNPNQLIGELIRVTDSPSQIFHPRSKIQLHIDGTIKMEFVNKLNSKLAQIGKNNIAYTVLPKERKYDDRFYKKSVLRNHNPDWLSSSPWSLYYDLNRYRQLYNNENAIIISQTDAGEILLNGENISKSGLKLKIEKTVELGFAELIFFAINNRVEFSHYIKVLSVYKSTVQDLRNEKSNQLFEKDFRELYGNEENEIRKLIPTNFIEIPEVVWREMSKNGPSSSSGT